MLLREGRVGANVRNRWRVHVIPRGELKPRKPWYEAHSLDLGIRMGGAVRSGGFRPTRVGQMAWKL